MVHVMLPLDDDDDEDEEEEDDDDLWIISDPPPDSKHEPLVSLERILRALELALFIMPFRCGPPVLSPTPNAYL